MHVVEVELRLKVRLAGPGKEVQAAVLRQDPVALLHHRPHRRVYEYIVIAMAVGICLQLLVADVGGVHVMELHAILGSLLHGEDRGGTVQPGLIDIRYHHDAGLAAANSAR